MIRVEGAFALELQHLAPIVIERVNTYYGWRCIGKLVLKQGPVRRAEKKRPAPPVLSAADREQVDGGRRSPSRRRPSRPPSTGWARRSSAPASRTKA